MFFNELYTKMKNILIYTFNAGLSSLQRKKGCFELLGIDFMIDKEFKPYLIEINTNPALLLGY